MKASATRTGVRIELTTDEALILAALLGRTRDPLANWYDPLADVLEAKAAASNGNTSYDNSIYEQVGRNPIAREIRDRYDLI